MLIAINLAFSFIYRSTIAWQDHIGGLIVGRADHRRLRLRAAQEPDASSRPRAAVAVLAILIVIVVLRTNHLTAEFGQAAGL